MSEPTQTVQPEQRDLWLQFIKATRENNTTSQQEAIKKLAELKTASLVSEGVNNLGVQRIEQFVISRLQPTLSMIDLDFDYTEAGFDIICHSKPEGDQSLVYRFNYDGSTCSFDNVTVQTMDGETTEVNDVELQPIGPALCNAITNDNPSLFTEHEGTLAEYFDNVV